MQSSDIESMLTSHTQSRLYPASASTHGNCALARRLKEDEAGMRWIMRCHNIAGNCTASQ